MMNLASFFTVPLTTQTGAPAAGQTPASAQGNDAALDFFEIFLARLNENPQTATPQAGRSPEKTAKPLPLQSDNSALEKASRLDIVHLLAESDEIREEIEAYRMGEQESLDQTLTLNQQAFDEILRPLDAQEKTEDAAANIEILNGTDHARIPSLENLPGLSGHPSAAQLLQKIEALKEDGGSHAALIALDLSPAQIAALQERAAGAGLAPQPAPAEGSREQEQAELTEASILAASVAPLPAKTQTRSAEMPAPGTVEELPSPNAAAGPPEDKPAPPRGMTGTQSNLPPQTQEHADRAAHDGNPHGHERRAETPAGPKDIREAKDPGLKPEPGVIRNAPEAAAQGLLSYLSAGGREHDGVIPVPAMTAAGQAASLLLHHAPQAVQAHPAAQTVAVALLQKSADGSDKTFRLQMDPPELGRVEVRMNFGRDKTLKLHLVVEKPETFALLQRDAHVLERTLHSIGLETEGGMDFSLAQDGGTFGRDNAHNGASLAGGGLADETIETIHSTLTWSVDPQTGHTRYSILA